MAVALTVLALVFLIGGDTLTGAAAYVAIVALFFYTGSFAIGLGPVSWLLISEIYPVRVRASAMSVATFANWAANFVVTVSFLTLLSAITNAGTFFLFAFLTLVAVAYFWRRVPETKGRSWRHLRGDRWAEGLRSGGPVALRVASRSARPSPGAAGSGVSWPPRGLSIPSTAYPRCAGGRGSTRSAAGWAPPRRRGRAGWARSARRPGGCARRRAPRRAGTR